MNTAEVVAQLGKLFQTYPQIIAAYLYGSQISGYNSRKSDLDLAVVIEEEHIDYKQSLKFSLCSNYRDLYLKVSQIFKGFDLDLRIITLKNSPTFLFQVIKGQCVYRKSDQEKLTFETKVLQHFYDSQHIRDIYSHYLRQAFE